MRISMLTYVSAVWDKTTYGFKPHKGMLYQNTPKVHGSMPHCIQTLGDC